MSLSLSILSFCLSLSVYPSLLVPVESVHTLSSSSPSLSPTLDPDKPLGEKDPMVFCMFIIYCINIYLVKDDYCTAFFFIIKITSHKNQGKTRNSIFRTLQLYGKLPSRLHRAVSSYRHGHYSRRGSPSPTSHAGST